MFNSCDTGQNRCHMTAAAIPIAVTISSIKHHVRGLTKTSRRKHLMSSFWNGHVSALYTSHRPLGLQATYEVSCHILCQSPPSYLLTT